MENLYAPPTVENDAPLRTLDAAGLSELDDRALNKLYNRSCNVRVIGWLLLLGSLLSGFGAIDGRRKVEAGVFSDSNENALLLGISVFYFAAAVAVIQRPSAARIVGIIACVPMLVSIPIGTIIGIAGLFAFVNAKELFGPDRIRHAELKREYKVRKLSRKWKRQQERRSP